MSKQTTSITPGRPSRPVSTTTPVPQRVTTIPRQTTTATPGTKFNAGFKSSTTSSSTPPPKAPPASTTKSAVTKTSSSSEIEQRQAAILARLQALREERPPGGSGGGSGNGSRSSTPPPPPVVVRPAATAAPPSRKLRFHPFYTATQELEISQGDRSVQINVGQRVQIPTTASSVLDEAEKTQQVFLAHLRKQSIDTTSEFVNDGNDESNCHSAASRLCRDTPTQQQSYLERHLKKDMMKRVYLGERGVIIGVVTNIRVEKEEEDPEEAFSSTTLLAKYNAKTGGASTAANESGDFVMLRFADGVEKSFPVAALDEVNQLLNPPKSAKTSSATGPTTTSSQKPSTDTPPTVMSEIDRRLAKLQQKKVVGTNDGAATVAASVSGTIGSKASSGGGGGGFRGISSDGAEDDDMDALIRSHAKSANIALSHRGGPPRGGLTTLRPKPVALHERASISPCDSSDTTSATNHRDNSEETSGSISNTPPTTNLLSTQPPSHPVGYTHFHGGDSASSTPVKHSAIHDEQSPVGSPIVSPPSAVTSTTTNSGSHRYHPTVSTTATKAVPNTHKRGAGDEEEHGTVVVAVSLSTARSESDGRASTIRMSPDFGRDESVPSQQRQCKTRIPSQEPLLAKLSTNDDQGTSDTIAYERLSRFKGKTSLGTLAPHPPPAYVSLQKRGH